MGLSRFLIYFLIVYFFSSGTLLAQNFNAQINIILKREVESKISEKLLQNIKNSINEYVNQKNWSNEDTLVHQRINMNFLLTIIDYNPDTGFFTAEAQVQYSRPVYNTTYLSRLFFINDAEFNFNYLDGQNLDVELNVYDQQNELSLLLAYYCYLIMGIDSATFKKSGGTEFFKKADAIVQTAQASNFSSWKQGASENFDNRYWLSENFNNQSMIFFRNFLYSYGRKVLDNMHGNIGTARKQFFSASKFLQYINNIRPTFFAQKLLMLSIHQELFFLFAQADGKQQEKAYKILSIVDPANITKYKKLIK